MTHLTWVTAMLGAALQGDKISGDESLALQGQVPEATLFWRTSDKAIWAVFPVAEDYVSQSDIEGIKKARKHALEPVFVVQAEPHYSVSEHYCKGLSSAICMVGGQARLLRAINLPRRRTTRPLSKTRIPVDVIAAGLSSLGDGAVKESVKRLHSRYLRQNRTDLDAREQKILTDHAGEMLAILGLDGAKLRAAAMVHTLEQGGLGASRDHFFHSFFNYFLGLKVMGTLKEKFLAFKGPARVDWDVDPLLVWFLTAMWHDTGYLLLNTPQVLDTAVGEDSPDLVGMLVGRFLNRPAVQRGLRLIASLMGRLTGMTVPTTAWIEPGETARLTETADAIFSAMREDVGVGHGATGALRLYADYEADIDRMDEEQRAHVRQTVLLACCSIPFHDGSFRDKLRQRPCGCRISTVLLPYAALLAFIDSLQDDNRHLGQPKGQMRWLDDLSCDTKTGVLRARTLPAALPSGLLLDKIIEATDIVSALQQPAGALHVTYPPWMGVDD